MPQFFFSECQILNNLKTNAEELKRFVRSGDTLIQAEIYKQQALLYLEYIKIGDTDEKRHEAIEFFSKAIALNADPRTTVFCLYKRASLKLIEAKKLEQSKTCFAKCTSLKKAQAKVNECMADFIKACNLAKNDSETWLAYASALVDLERLEEAIFPLEQALILRPQDPRTNELIRKVISSDSVSENCLHHIKALMSIKSILKKNSQIDSYLYLWLQVVQLGDKNVISYLAEELKVDTQTHDGRGNTALHYAARSGHVHLIKPLVEKYGINPNAENHDGLTPIAIAIEAERTYVQLALISVGAAHSLVPLPLIAFENFSVPNKKQMPLANANLSLSQEEEPFQEETTGLRRAHAFSFSRFKSP